MPKVKGVRRWRIAILLGVGVLINYFDGSSFCRAGSTEPGVWDVQPDLRIRSKRVQLDVPALQLPMGVLLDRFGVRVIGCLSALVWSLLRLRAAPLRVSTGFVASRLLLGIGEAPTFPASAKATGAWFPRQERSLATAMFDGLRNLRRRSGFL